MDEPETDEHDVRGTITVTVLVVVIVGGLVAWGSFGTLKGLPADRVGAWGLIVSGFGLLLSIVGFGITWLQISRTRSAAQKVSKALSNIRRDYASFDVATELRSARESIGRVLIALGDQRWGEAMSSLDTLRVCLVKMSSVSNVMDVADTGWIKDEAGRVMSHHDNILSVYVDRPQQIQVQEMCSSIRTADNFLISLEQKLKDKIRAK